MLRLGQFPLVGLLGNLPAHLAFGRIAGEDDLGAARIVENPIQNARIVIVEVAKSSERPAFAFDRIKEPHRVRFPTLKIDPQNLGGVGIANEMRIERFTMATQPPKCVEVGLEEIRARPHLGEDDEVVEIRHGLAHQIGLAGLRARVLRCGVDGEIAHEIGVHPLVLEVLQKLTKAAQIYDARRLRQPPATGD